MFFHNLLNLIDKLDNSICLKYFRLPVSSEKSRVVWPSGSGPKANLVLKQVPQKKKMLC